MAWSYKAGSGASGGNSNVSNASVVVTLGAAVSVGDRILVGIAMWQTTGNPSVTTVGDTVNTYTLDVVKGPNAQDANTLYAIYSATVTTAGTPTITVAAVQDGMAVAVGAWAGVSTTAGAGAALDKSASAIGVSLSPSSGATATTTAANELAIGLYADDGWNQGSPGGGSFTTRTYHGSGSDADIGLFDLDTGASGSAITFSATVGNASVNWGAIVAVYKLAAAVLPPVGNKVIVSQAVKNAGYL